MTDAPAEIEGLTSKAAWWAGARAGLGLPPDTPREVVAQRLAATRAALSLSDTKPLDDPRLQQLFGDAIEGALAFGYQGENAAPPGHWLERFWRLGRAEAEKTLAATPQPMPARLNDQRIVELMRPLADDALIRPHVIAAARAVIAEYERLNGISATPRQPLSEARIEDGRHETFSTNNPFCPCDSKTMLKAVRWAERAHGITPAQGKETQG